MTRVALSCHVQNHRKLLTLVVIFTVKTYENEDKIRALYDCKSSITKLSLIEIFLAFIKKCAGSGWIQRDTEYQIVKTRIIFTENYLTKTKLSWKTRFIWAKKKCKEINEKSWSNFFSRVGSDATMVIHACKSFQL